MSNNKSLNRKRFIFIFFVFALFSCSNLRIKNKDLPGYYYLTDFDPPYHRLTSDAGFYDWIIQELDPDDYPDKEIGPTFHFDCAYLAVNDNKDKIIYSLQFLLVKIDRNKYEVYNMTMICGPLVRQFVYEDDTSWIVERGAEKWRLFKIDEPEYFKEYCKEYNSQVFCD